MNLIRHIWDTTHTLVEYQLTVWGIDTRDDTGALSTEAAVVTGVLVALAVAAGVILMAKMRSNANAIPDTVSPPG